MKKFSLFFIVAMFFVQTNSALAKEILAKEIFSQKDQNSGAVKIDPLSPKQLAVSGFADTIEDLLPSVVNISAVQEVKATAGNSIDQILLGELPKTPLFEEFRNQLENQFRGQQTQKKKVSSIGSGFIISKDGFIVTNSHVIEDADEITVSLNDSSKHKAKVVGLDKRTDLALLKIEAGKDLKFAKFGDSNKARIGDWVIVVGNPYGLGGSVSVGIVSARGRDITNGQSDDFIQTDAAINKGNSGGPMFNAKGEVIGISTAIVSPSGGNVGIGFATPSASAMQVVQQLKEQGEVIRGWLGISVQDVSEEIAESMKMGKPKGAFVVEVISGGPADNAGILPTDIITKFDDQEITEMKILPRTVSKYPIGKTAKVTILRRGKVKTIEVKVAKMKELGIKKSETKLNGKKHASKAEVQILGLGLVPLTNKVKLERKVDSSIKGLLVTEVSAKSEAAEKGVIAGDILLSVNQAPIDSINDLKEVVEAAQKSTKKLFLFLKRGDNNYGLVLTTK